MSATELRAKLYGVLDEVAESGKPVEILRKGRIFRISIEEAAPKAFSASQLVSRSPVIQGDPDDVVHMDWSHEWKPFPGQDS